MILVKVQVKLLFDVQKSTFDRPMTIQNEYREEGQGCRGCNREEIPEQETALSFRPARHGGRADQEARRDERLVKTSFLFNGSFSFIVEI